jgi:hypothetical protein
MGNIGLTNLKKEFKVEPNQTLDLGDIIVPSRKDDGR